jgi:hypothetical protein
LQLLLIHQSLALKLSLDIIDFKIYEVCSQNNLIMRILAIPFFYAFMKYNEEGNADIILVHEILLPYILHIIISFHVGVVAADLLERNIDSFF